MIVDYVGSNWACNDQLSNIATLSDLSNGFISLLIAFPITIVDIETKPCLCHDID